MPGWSQDGCTRKGYGMGWDGDGHMLRKDREEPQMGDGKRRQRRQWRQPEGPRGSPTPWHPLTLHIKGDEGLGGTGGTGSVADVLPRVLLRGAGDHQRPIHHPVLPRQRRPQLRPLNAGLRVPYGQHQHPSPRHQGADPSIPATLLHPPSAVPLAVQCSVAVSPATTVTAGGTETSGAPGCRCVDSTVTSTRACAEPRALCAVQM